MNRSPIRVLPEFVVGRIAAGEVVERPAAAVKELVENSLDAAATSISVEVEGAATDLLRVSDDGSGIPAGELSVACARHATSKITAAEDLTSIRSLGFRGEGLAAIGAVSRLKVLSRTPEAEAAAEISVDGGALSAVIPGARGVGTTVEIRDLFFNTPARRKYLKSPVAEIRVISQLLQAYALANPTVAFRFLQNGRETLHFVPAADREERLGQMIGRKRLSRMVPVLVDEPGMEIEGFLGAPEDSRARSGHQVTILNGRWVVSPLLKTVIRRAYDDLIPPGRHPEAFLVLSLPHDELDVNVHPTKREVRFLRERELYPRLTALLRRRVEGHFPSLHLGSMAGDDSLPADLEGGSSVTAAPIGPDPNQNELGFYETTPAAREEGWVSDGTPAAGSVLRFPDMAASKDGDRARAMANLWQIHETYIMARVRNGVLVIDQHAAHERILYEQALRRIQGDPPASQELLFPHVVELAPTELAVLAEAKDVLEAVGFHLGAFGGGSVLVNAIPAGVREWRHGALLRDILDHFTELPVSLDIQERVARSVACHGAVKAGQRLTLTEMNELVDQLFATSKPQGDPHGRPVFLRIELSELHRRFGRSG